MPTDAYQGLLRQIQQLSVEEQLQLFVDLGYLLKWQAPQPTHSILELEGLGKEIWQDIDVDRYLQEERDSWEGPQL